MKKHSLLLLILGTMHVGHGQEKTPTEDLATSFYTDAAIPLAL